VPGIDGRPGGSDIVDECAGGDVELESATDAVAVAQSDKVKDQAVQIEASLAEPAPHRYEKQLESEAQIMQLQIMPQANYKHPKPPRRAPSAKPSSKRSVARSASTPDGDHDREQKAAAIFSMQNSMVALKHSISSYQNQVELEQAYLEE